MRESAFVRFRLLAVLIFAAATVAAGVLLSGALTARAAEEPTALTLTAAQTDSGEAKFYTDLYTSFNKTIASVKDILQTAKIRTENKLILNLKDLDILIKDKDLFQRIRKVLSENEPIDGVKQKLHVPILLLHECQITRDAESMDELYKQMIIEKHREAAKKYFDSQDGKLSSEFLYDKVVFHLILFPVPSKNDVVDSFFKTASAMRGS